MPVQKESKPTQINKFIQSIAHAQRASKSAQDGVYREWGLIIGKIVDVEDPQGLRRVRVALESKDMKVASFWAIRAQAAPWMDTELPKVGQVALVAAIGGDPHDLVLIATMDSTLLSEGAVEGIDNPDRLEKSASLIGINPAADLDFKAKNYPVHRRSEGGTEDKEKPAPQKATVFADEYPDWWTPTESVIRVDGKRHTVSEGLYHHERVSFEEAIKLPSLPNPKGYFYRAENYSPNGPDEANRHFSPGLPPEHLSGLWTGLLYVDSALDQRFGAKGEDKQPDEILVLLKGKDTQYYWERTLTTEGGPWGKTLRAGAFLKLGTLGVDIDNQKLSNVARLEPLPQLSTLGLIWLRDRVWHTKAELPKMDLSKKPKWSREKGKTLQLPIDATVKESGKQPETPSPQGNWPHIDEKREEFYATARRQWQKKLEDFGPKIEPQDGTGLFLVAKAQSQLNNGSKPEYFTERVYHSESGSYGKFLWAKSLFRLGRLDRVGALKAEKARLKFVKSLDSAQKANLEWNEAILKAETAASEFFSADRADKDVWDLASDEGKVVEAFGEAQKAFDAALDAYDKAQGDEKAHVDAYLEQDSDLEAPDSGLALNAPPQSGDEEGEGESKNYEFAQWGQLKADQRGEFLAQMRGAKWAGAKFNHEQILAQQGYTARNGDRDGKVVQFCGLAQIGLFHATKAKKTEAITKEIRTLRAKAFKAQKALDEPRLDLKNAQSSKDFDKASGKLLGKLEEVQGLWQKVADKEKELDKLILANHSSLRNSQLDGLALDEPPDGVDDDLLSVDLIGSVWARDWEGEEGDWKAQKVWPTDFKVLARAHGAIEPKPSVYRERFLTTTTTFEGKRTHARSFFKFGTINPKSQIKFENGKGEDLLVADILDKTGDYLVLSEPPDCLEEKDPKKSLLWQGSTYIRDYDGEANGLTPSALKTILRSNALLNKPKDPQKPEVFWRERLLSTDSSTIGKRTQVRSFLGLGTLNPVDKDAPLENGMVSTILGRNGDQIAKSEPLDWAEATKSNELNLLPYWRSHMWVRAHTQLNFAGIKFGRADDLRLLSFNRDGEAWRERALLTEGMPEGKLSVARAYLKLGFFDKDIDDQSGDKIQKTKLLLSSTELAPRDIWEGTIWADNRTVPPWQGLGISSTLSQIAGLGKNPDPTRTEANIYAVNRQNRFYQERLIRSERLGTWSSVQLEDILKLAEAGDTLRPDLVDGAKSSITLPEPTRTWGGSLVFLPGIESKGKTVWPSFIGTVAQGGDGSWSWGHVLHSRKSKDSDSWIAQTNCLFQVADITNTSQKTGTSAGKLYPVADSKLEFPVPAESWAGYMARESSLQTGARSNLFMCLPNRNGDYLWERALIRETQDGLYTMPFMEVPILPTLDNCGFDKWGLGYGEAGLPTDNLDFVGSLYEDSKSRPSAIRTVQQNKDGIIADERVISTETLIYRQPDGKVTGAPIVRLKEAIKLAVNPPLPPLSEDMIGLMYVTDESPGRVFVVLRDCYGNPVLQEMATANHSHMPLEQPMVRCDDKSKKPQSTPTAGTYFIPK